jgi:mono/diheme cytochrome c family protein
MDGTVDAHVVDSKDMSHATNTNPGTRLPGSLPTGGLLRVTVTSILLLQANATFAAAPPALFVKACAPCHGKDGKATTPAARKLGVKDLSLSLLTETEIQRQMLDGRTGSDGSIKMPSFRETLKPAELELLARYVKSLQKPTQPSPPTAK